jgi:hypothetical protein
MSDLTDAELTLALNGECPTVEVVVWLAREVKRCREVQRAAVSRREEVRGVVIRVLDRFCVPPLERGMRDRVAEEIADEVTRRHDDVRGVAKRALDRHLVGASALGVGLRNRIAESIADELDVAVSLGVRAAEPQESPVIQLSGNAPLEIFPFVTPLHCEVVLRHKDDESQDIEMTPDEADHVADRLRVAAAAARTAKAET